MYFKFDILREKWFAFQWSVLIYMINGHWYYDTFFHIHLSLWFEVKNGFAQCIIACITFWNFNMIEDCWSVIYIPCLIYLCFVLLQCSVSCGEGEIVRQVICFNYNHQRTSDHQCNAAIRPDTTRSCKAAADCSVETSVNSNVMNKSNSVSESSPSSDWRTGPWTKVQTLWLVHWCTR